NRCAVRGDCDHRVLRCRRSACRQCTSGQLLSDSIASHWRGLEPGYRTLRSILAPVLGGILLGLQWPNSWIFVSAAVPAVLSCLMMVCLGVWKAAGIPSRVANPAGVGAAH